MPSESSEKIANTFPSFMIVPSLSCPAKCSYCFGPHHGSIMNKETLDQVLDVMERVVFSERSNTQEKERSQSHKIKIMFHGGEPLSAGYEFWQYALSSLKRRFAGEHFEISVQSNLWLLDEEFCRLFVEHNVEIGTSLDGPQDINDLQRGEGYFARTMEGIHRARAWGLDVGCIATFTPQNLPFWREVFDFFLNERIGFSIHPAVRSIGNGRSSLVLSSAEYRTLLEDMLSAYIERRHEIRISSLDQMCQGVAFAEGKVCTFRDCLGMFLAFDPEGNIFPCQRLCGKPEWSMGNVREYSTLEALYSSPVALQFIERQRCIEEACAGCCHFGWCKGGCPYNAWASKDLNNGSDVRDPYCEAYKELFDRIQLQLIREMGSEENHRALEEDPSRDGQHPLFRRGPLIDLARGGSHPSQIARTARRVVAAVELAKGPDILSAAARLVEMDICKTPEIAERSLANLYDQLHPKITPLNNLYLHITFDCQLCCTHCYAHAGINHSRGDEEAKSMSFSAVSATLRDAISLSEMPAYALLRLIHEAWEVGFRQVIITGGEPLIHSQRDELLAMLTQERKRLSVIERTSNIHPVYKRMNLVLRTNFAMPLSPTDIHKIAQAFDQVVVSLDGDEATHDARRGKGSYTATLKNLDSYEYYSRGIRNTGELSLAAVLSAKDIQDEQGDSVRALGERLGIRRIRFRPLLPLGRAKDWPEPPTSEALGSHLSPMELIESGFQPVSSCGLGQNLYVEPSGEVFPCYAYHRPHAYIGNVITEGLSAIVKGESFKDLPLHNVDTNPRCSKCEVRYLCGGACRAWGGEMSQHNLDASPQECSVLYSRAARLYAEVVKYFNIRYEPKGEKGLCLNS